MSKNFERVDFKFKVMEKQVLKDLPMEELLSCNGGHVPMAWYMDSDSISANGSFAGGFFRGLRAALNI